MSAGTPISAGTITVGAGSMTVTGQGTNWLSAGAQAGDYFWAAGLIVRIAAVPSNTQLTLAKPWPGAALAAADYEIQLTYEGVRYLTKTAQLIDMLGSGNIEALAALETQADRLAYATGDGTWSLTPFTEYARSLLGAGNQEVARAALGNAVPGDGASAVGFIGGEIAFPYMRHASSDTIIQLQRLISTSAGYSGYVIINGRLVLSSKVAGTPDSAGRITITLPASFGSAEWTPIVSNGNAAMPIVVGVVSTTASQMTVEARLFNGNPYTGIYQINYVGIGDA